MKAHRLSVAVLLATLLASNGAWARNHGVPMVELPLTGASIVPNKAGLGLGVQLPAINLELPTLKVLPGATSLPAVNIPVKIEPLVTIGAQAVVPGGVVANSGVQILNNLAPRPNGEAQHVQMANKAFDGSGKRSADFSEPILTPSFEPATQTPGNLFTEDGEERQAKNGGNGGDNKNGGGKGGNGGGNGGGDNGGNNNNNNDGDRGPYGPDGHLKPLSFPNQAQVARLHSFDPDQMIYGVLKRIKPTGPRPAWAKKQGLNDKMKTSRGYWAEYKAGAEVGIVSRGENVFGEKEKMSVLGDRKTTITEAYFKKISKLTRDDLKGIFPASELRAPLAQIRKAVIDRMEEARRQWNPTETPITADTEVRVIKFKPFAQLFREEKGADAIPEVEQPKERAPLQATAEGKLSPMATFLPRAVYLDVDALDGPVSAELLSDMMKLQRTGVYFVALSRKPYDAPGGVYERLIKRMSAYQLTIQLPIRFMAVTDDGAVISEFPRGGNPKPISVASFNDASIDVLRDAAQKASESKNLSPKSVVAVPIAVKPGPKEYPVRIQFAAAKSLKAEQLAGWVDAFRERLEQQGLKYNIQISGQEGSYIVTVMRGDLGSSFDRLQEALGAKFGLYVNPSDLLVLSDDPAVLKTNPHLDFGALTGLKGASRVENALGLLLGEHRDSKPGDLSGSASRVAQFRRDRTRYMSDFLLKQDGQEQNINFYSGHVVHASNDWLIWSLQNGKRPTRAEYEKNLRDRWEDGLKDIKAVGLPPGEDMAGWLDSRVAGALNMYEQVLAAHDRGEILVGAEIPNFFMLKDRKKRTEEVKRRYVVHTIFDFIALRPDPKKPGHATLVIYDFKTGPAQSRGKLEKDIQVLTYSLFAKLRLVGKEFPTPYFSGDKPFTIDDVRVEFIYNALRQPTTIDNWSLDSIRSTIIRTLNGIYASEQQMLGLTPAKKAKAAKGSAKKPAAKAKPVAKKKPVVKKKP